ncbi:MAG: DUF3169 family protein [Planctomycetaceae bacterium]|jgi:magnesium-transporting ATPase (P-type)|nr:DUF3169 family protein [Planctomycetaceae bacterium]
MAFQPATKGNAGGTSGTNRPLQLSPQQTAPRNSDEDEDFAPKRRRLFDWTVWFFIIGLVVINAGIFLGLENIGKSLRQLIYTYNIRHLPWWTWSLLFLVAIILLVGYKIYAAWREAREQTEVPNLPVSMSATVKPKNFNTAVDGTGRGGFQRQVHAEHESFLDRTGISSGFSFLGENKLLISLILGGGILLAVLVYFGYKLMTMEWIDAEGYPIKKPFWLYLLPFLLLGGGVLVYKIIGIIRENAAERNSRASKTFSSTRPQPRLQQPTGFNMPSAKRGGFQQQQSSLRDWFSNPVAWIVVGVIGVLLLIVVLLLIFR